MVDSEGALVKQSHGWSFEMRSGHVTVVGSIPFDSYQALVVRVPYYTSWDLGFLFKGRHVPELSPNASIINHLLPNQEAMHFDPHSIQTPAIPWDEQDSNPTWIALTVNGVNVAMFHPIIHLFLTQTCDLDHRLWGVRWVCFKG